MSGLTLVTGPTVEPVSLSELKVHLHMDQDMADDDAQLTAILVACRQIVEAHLKRALITQTWMLTLDRIGVMEEPLWEGLREGADMPRARNYIVLPKPPLQSVTSFVSYDDDDNASTFAASNYFVDTSTTPGRVVVRSGSSWPVPSRVASGIEITYVAGYGGGWNDVPMTIRTGLMEFVRWVFDDCGGEMPSDGGIPSIAASLLQPYMVFDVVGGGFNG